MREQLSGRDELSPQQRLASIVNTLRPAELRVAELLRESPELIVESTAQELAERVGVARTSVIRTVQALGYDGYAQFRVAVARYLSHSYAVTGPVATAGAGELGVLRGDVERLAHALPDSLGLLTEAGLVRVIEALATARRVQCVANGLSAPLAVDLSMRLTAAGRLADYTGDVLAQQIVARQLGTDDVLLIVSGSGSNELTLRAARAGRDAGATVVAVTSFATSPLVTLCDLPLVIASPHGSFRDELEVASRIPHAVFLSALAARVAVRLGKPAAAARGRALSVLADNLSDGH